MTVPSTNAPISAYNFAAANVYAADGGNNALLTNTLVLVSTGPHFITGIAAWNVNTSDIFIQVFDAASTSGITLGTTKPNWSWRVPGGSATVAGAWEEKFVTPGRLRINNGIVIAATTTAIGNTAPATGAQLNLYYL